MQLFPTAPPGARSEWGRRWNGNVRMGTGQQTHRVDLHQCSGQDDNDGKVDDNVDIQPRRHRSVIRLLIR